MESERSRKTTIRKEKGWGTTRTRRKERERARICLVMLWESTSRQFDSNNAVSRFSDA